MKNVDITIKGNILTIVVDLKKEIGPSKSGKTILIASTEGNPEIVTGVSMGLNIYRKK